MSVELKPGPHDPVPASGRRHGYANRKKLVRHTGAIIDLLEHALRHARRALERAKGERMRDHE
jgi:hypothetical protein